MICASRFGRALFALAVIGAMPAPSAAQSAFEGIYIAQAVDAEGNEYRRAVNIERQGERFIVTWVLARMAAETVVLEPTWVGVGIATADSISVSFFAGDTIGIVVYQFNAGKQQLTGRWTLAGDDETIYSETLTRLPDKAAEPATLNPIEQLAPHAPIGPVAYGSPEGQ